MNYTREQAEEVLKDYEDFLAPQYKASHLIINFRFEDFLNEKFKPQLEVGKWYKNVYGTSLLILELLDNNEVMAVVVHYYGEWDGKKSYKTTGNITLMTEHEIFELLKKEAIKRGYKDGNYKCFSTPDRTIKLGETVGYRLDDGQGLWIRNIDLGNKIFNNQTGEWAPILDQIDEEIKELEEGIKKLEEKIKNLKRIK